MKVGISTSDVLKSKADLVLFLTEEKTKDLAKSVEKPFDLVKDHIPLSSFKGKISNTLVVPVKGNPFKRVILSGLGKEKEADYEIIRRAAHSALHAVAKLKIKSISTVVPKLKLNETNILRAISDGFRLSNYDFDKYKTEKDSRLSRISDATIHVKNVTKDMKTTLLYSKVTCDATILCRDLQSDNADDINSEYLAKFAQKLAKSHNLKLKLLNKRQLQKEGLNLITGVAQGSRFEPHLIILEYNGDKNSKEKTAIVGKGITYDTGGLDIKTRWMADMHMDMSGAAIVLSAIKAAAELKLKKNIIAVAPVAENAVGQNSQKPGTVVKSYSGKTVEIGNTDAEGRLVLADALAYVNKNYNPSKIIDFATLTGAMLIALGHNHAGIWTTDEKLTTELKAAGDTSGDLLWEFPLVKDYAKYMKSKKADLNNISSYRAHGMGVAGSTTAALFLKNFVGSTTWAHIDVAGTAMFEKRRFYRPRDGTGFGVRLLLDYFSQ